jgi:hypothetical protein
MSITTTAIAFAISSAAGACKGQAGGPESARDGEAAASSSTANPSGRALRVVAAPTQGPVDAIVRSAVGDARAAGRTLVVYVGATWCEPCQHFHHAAEHGDLDAEFPRVTLLEFDLDRDRDRLTAAKYVSKYIPLFALPAPDGSASGKQVEGGIKGDGAVAFIAPRLRAMLDE